MPILRSVDGYTCAESCWRQHLSFLIVIMKIRNKTIARSILTTILLASVAAQADTLRNSSTTVTFTGAIKSPACTVAVAGGGGTTIDLSDTVDAQTGVPSKTKPVELTLTNCGSAASAEVSLSSSHADHGKLTNVETSNPSSNAVVAIFDDKGTPITITSSPQSVSSLKQSLSGGVGKVIFKAKIDSADTKPLMGGGLKTDMTVDISYQ